MSNVNMWLDGDCKKCGYPVIEMPCSGEGEDNKDYKNACLNPNCEENKWHFVYDNEEEDYYNHSESYREVWRIPEK